MNEFQRQLLADEIDTLYRSIERYDDAISKLEHQLDVKRTNRKKAKERLEKLSEGIDW